MKANLRGGTHQLTNTHSCGEKKILKVICEGRNQNRMLHEKTSIQQPFGKNRPRGRAEALSLERGSRKTL